MTKKKNYLYPDTLPDNITLQEIDVGKQMGLSKDVISKFVFWQGEQWWQARFPPTAECPEGKIFFTKNPKDPRVLNYAVDDVNGRARGNINWSNGESGNPRGRPAGSKSKITVKSVCDAMGANPVELLTSVMLSDVGTLRKYGVKDVKSITLAQKLSIAKYLSDKIVPNLKPVEVGEDGDWQVNPAISEKTEEKRNQLQVYIPSARKPVTIEATDAELAEIEQDGVDKYLENHPEVVEEAEETEAKFVWEVPNG